MLNALFGSPIISKMTFSIAANERDEIFLSFIYSLRLHEVNWSYMVLALCPKKLLTGVVVFILLMNT